MSNLFMNSISNLDYTENGALTNESSKSALVDLFFHGAAIRKSRPEQIIEYFNNAFKEDATLALKILFYFRDIREGQGERQIFRIAMKNFLLNHKEWINENNLLLIPEFGRWDDLIYMLDEETINDKDYSKLTETISLILQKQLKEDLISARKQLPNISLLGKWMPSINASSKKTRKQGKLIAKLLGFSEKEYRKTLSELRKALKVVEINISNKQYNEIDYSKVPSLAIIKYIKAFCRHDKTRYEQYLNDLLANKKDVKINTATLYPYDIVHKIFINEKETLATLDLAWKNLPDYVDNMSGLVVADTSGSMYGTPLEVCLSLAVYISERNKNDAFKDYFITFSENPKLQKIEGETLANKIRNLKNATWGYNTDLQSVFDLVLDRAKAMNVPQDDMPKVLIIISDMEFDIACKYNSVTNFELIKQRYLESGYNMPKLVFWNVNSKNNQSPVTVNDKGVYLISGYSPIIMKQVFNVMDKDYTILDFIKNTVNIDRYKNVKY